jgi:ubiquinone/menaquinone biosynthesis C-methylase UbiE
MMLQFDYSEEPTNRKEHTEQYDKFYSRFASAYDWLVKILPIWRNWITAALPLIQGPAVLEVSFGTGYLLSQYADQFNTYGIDYNQRLARVAQENLRQNGKKADLQVANVESLPYKTGAFDTLVNTMAFSGYPDGNLSFSEMSRVLRPGGRIVMVDINYPRDRNWLGRTLTNGWKAGGDIIRDMPAIFNKFDFEFTDKEIGGGGSVHLYVAAKPKVEKS